MYLFREDLPILIVGCAVFCAIFIIGVFLQVKMIAALKHDQAIAWEINLAHSVLMIAIFSSSSILEIINYIQPSLYDNLGKWYCYLILPVILFGFFEMLFHSLYVSIYKYIFIVHSETVTRIGKQTIKRILLWTYFIILVSWTVSLAIRENFGSKKVFQNGVSCGVFHAFGTSNMEADGSIIRHLFSCSIDDLEQNKLENIIVNILTKVLCTSQSIINIIIGLNVVEIFFYLRIFRHMNRYVNFLDSNICRINRRYKTNNDSYFSLNRQVCPRNSVYLGLSDESQKQNSRNVRVNAQVTAVMTMLEFIGGCIFVIIRVSNHGGFIGKTLFMLLHFVVLPYGFLMNTRYNKNRIIEEGWINVLKNMVFSCKCSGVTPFCHANKVSNGDEGVEHAEMKHVSPEIFLVSNTIDSSMSKTTISDTLHSPIEEERKESDLKKQQPTCSYSTECLENDSDEFNRKLRSRNSTPTIDSVRKQIISDLLINVNDEDAYIKLLTQLVDVEEAHKYGKDIDELSYDYEELRVEQLPHFVGCSVRKMGMRITRLEMLLQCLKDDNNYRMCFDHFVDMEEDFLEHGC